jgi:hypothetical protein
MMPDADEKRRVPGVDVPRELGVPTWQEFQESYYDAFGPPVSIVAVYQQIIAMAIFDKLRSEHVRS